MTAPYEYEELPDGTVRVWLPRNVKAISTDHTGRIRSSAEKYAVEDNGKVKWIPQGFMGGSDHRP